MTQPQDKGTDANQVTLRAADVVRLLSRFGGHSVSKTPDPIPNSAVKCHSANGTASQDVGE